MYLRHPNDHQDRNASSPDIAFEGVSGMTCPLADCKLSFCVGVFMKVSSKSSAGAVLAVCMALAGCAGFSPDGGLNRVSTLTRDRTGMGVQRDSEEVQAQVSILLASDLTPDRAVEIALLNNKRLQATLAELGIAEADWVQAGRLRNPRLSVGRLAGNGATETDRAVMIDLAGLLTLPLRRAIEERRFDQAQLQTALQVVRLAADTRRAYFQAVAANQSLTYMHQAAEATEASAQLAQRMARAGNWSKLDEAREQVFHVEVSAQLARAEHAANASRERLLRLMGLWGKRTQIRLPDRLPALPEQPDLPADIENAALAQRLDVQVAKMETEHTARTLGLTRATRFVNVLEAGYQNTSTTGETRADGYEVELSLPLFDWGTARARRAESIYLRSLMRTADVAVLARSEVREYYSAYRTSFDVSRRYRDEIVPLRKRVSEEVLLRYNGMLVSVFELLTDARAQIASINAAIDAQRDFWIADTELNFARHGGSLSTAFIPAAGGMPAYNLPAPAAH
jgi:outer membrane protein TolC